MLGADRLTPNGRHRAATWLAGPALGCTAECASVAVRLGIAVRLSIAVCLYIALSVGYPEFACADAGAAEAPSEAEGDDGEEQVEPGIEVGEEGVEEQDEAAEPAPEPPLLAPAPAPPPPPQPRPPFSSGHPSPAGDSPKTRIESDDGVTVLSNRESPGSAPSDEGDRDDRDPVAAEASDSPPGTPPPPSDSPKVVDEPAALGLADIPIKRSKRKNKDDEDEGGSGWLWVLFGAAALLLVPIGLLLNRGARDGGQPVSRYPTIAGSPASSSSSPPASSSKPPADE